MAPLPSDRIGVIRPFENTEVVSEMTAQRLLQALRRFIARRGKPHVLQSDNYKSFKQLDKDLRQLVSTEMIDNIACKLTSHRIQWNFITERAPWMGGYWERLIRSMKTSLKKARMNLRPLTYNPDNPNNPEVLTPYHFLTGTHYVDIPEITKDEDEWVPKTVHVATHEELELATAFNCPMVETLESRKKLETGKNRAVISRTRRDSLDCESAASWLYCQPSNIKTAFNRASQRTVMDSVHRGREDVRN
ncbi:hypothetical protein T09_9312 [Trichinella sp. T9]|nr:hypothetical protein T09_9312 [Trichinella sp. T9]